VLDETAKDQFRAQRAQLEQDLIAAEKAGLTNQAGEIREAIAAISTQLANAFTPGGAPRKMLSEEKKAIQAVTVAIKRALEDVRETHPALWRHLQPPNLTVGPVFFQYAPDSPADWEL
jgi:hypothetical protein